MRKRFVAIVSLLIVVVVVLGLTLTGCNQQQNLPGIAWAEEETLLYDMYTNQVKSGTLEIKTIRLLVGEQALPKFPTEKHNITSSSSGGTLVVKTVKDLALNVLVYSEALLNGFVPIASYKEVNTSDAQYTVKARYDGTRYFYSYNGAEEEKVRIKTGFMDNELMYNLIRCYEIENNYTTSYTLINPSTGSKEKLSVAVTSEGTFGGFEYVNGSGESAIAASGTKVIAISFTRTEIPTGKSIAVFYTVENAEGTDGFYLSGDPAKGVTNRSSHIPVRIVENDVEYLLTKVTAK